MQFEIYDTLLKRNVRKPEKFYVNSNGILFTDCDPNGIDMSGKIRIFPVDSNRFKNYIHGENR